MDWWVSVKNLHLTDNLYQITLSFSLFFLFSFFSRSNPWDHAPVGRRLATRGNKVSMLNKGMQLPFLGLYPRSIA